MEKEVAKFSVKYIQILDESGNVDAKLMPTLSATVIKEMYQTMVLTRVFDDKAIKLQRQGRIGTFASVQGQEACQIPSAMQLENTDLVFPAFREHGVFLTRNAPPEIVLQFWGGDERGMRFDKNVNMFPVAITVGGHLPHAAGAAMAYQHLGKKSVAVAYFGDGATSEGDFHEGMNFAGVFKAPVIFICQNNQWAISTPVSEQSASQTLAQKAIAYGFEGVQVDGNDAFAVYKVFKDALTKARAGKGPTFIECITYRLGDHTTSDDATRYRKEKEVAAWKLKDPLTRLKKYMLKKKLLNEKSDKEIWQNAEQKINDAVTKYEAMALAPGEEIFNYMFGDMPKELEEQKARFMQEAG